MKRNAPSLLTPVLAGVGATLISQVDARDRLTQRPPGFFSQVNALNHLIIMSPRVPSAQFQPGAIDLGAESVGELLKDL